MQRCIPAVLVGILLAGGSALQSAEAEKSLYQRLGGQPAVEAVANGLVDRILADNRVNKWFAHAAASTENANAYKAKLATFICAGVGGPCKYTGLDMVSAHKGRAVTSEAFDAVAQDLVAQLDQLKVPAKEKGEVMQIIGSLKPSIVQSGPVQSGPVHSGSARN
jgi:hemoglobin